MTVENYIKAQLAELAWKTAHQSGHNTTVAIALAVANRVRERYQGNWLEAFNEAQIPAGQHPDPRDPEFQRLLAEIDTIYDGGQDVLTNGALWFIKDATLPIMGERTAELGGFTFYK